MTTHTTAISVGRVMALATLGITTTAILQAGAVWNRGLINQTGTQPETLTMVEITIDMLITQSYLLLGVLSTITIMTLLILILRTLPMGKVGIPTTATVIPPLVTAAGKRARSCVFSLRQCTARALYGLESVRSSQSSYCFISILFSVSRQVFSALSMSNKMFAYLRQSKSHIKRAAIRRCPYAHIATTHIATPPTSTHANIPIFIHFRWFQLKSERSAKASNSD